METCARGAHEGAHPHAAGTVLYGRTGRTDNGSEQAVADWRALVDALSSEELGTARLLGLWVPDQVPTGGAAVEHYTPRLAVDRWRINYLEHLPPPARGSAAGKGAKYEDRRGYTGGDGGPSHT
jgi:hypothetical protein